VVVDLPKKPSTKPAGIETTPSRATQRRTPDARATQTAEADAKAPAERDDGPRDAQRATRPMAVLVPRSGEGEVRVLQDPHPEDALTADRLRLETVQYTVDGRIAVRGQAAAGDDIVLYIDDAVAGRTRTRGDGTWRIVPELDIAPGLHTLRIEAVGPDGSVVARVETPFSSQPLVDSLGREDLIVVQPGGNLWTIARRTYGEGLAYRVIYRANSDQISDPDLIYPGQVFVLPDAPE
jgi:nucleoid-associated protein YgaU